jgi:nitrous oxidase accessory protein
MNFSTACITVVVATGLAGDARAADTIVVSPAGRHRSVAAAVQIASPGSRIVVRAGTYREPPIIIDKPLTIAGEGRPVIQPVQTTLIRVTAHDVTIRGLVLAHVPASFVDDRAALRFEHVQRCVAEDLEIIDAPFGIYASDSSDCRIVGNIVRDGGSDRRAWGNAIHLWSCRRMTVADNVVSAHRDGLYFEFVQDTTIERNLSQQNARYGLHFMFSNRCAYRSNRFVQNGAGVAVMYTHEVAMEANEFAMNRGPTAYGLLLKDIGDSRLIANRFADNTVALLIEGGGHLTVENNRFRNNGWGVKLMANSPGNRFAGNSFAGNSFDMATNSRSTEAIVVGNWWDRYQGYDLDHDGRGDVAFRPVSLFTLLVAENPPSMVLMRSAFVDLLEAAERALPVLTPQTLVDSAPLMVMPQ